MNLSVDTREVLTHLNALGYRNISAEQLKEFIRDLKKLIKYESRIDALPDVRHIKDTCKFHEGDDIFSKLHDNKTTSIQAKYGTMTINKARSKSVSPSRDLKPRNILTEFNHSKPKAESGPKESSKKRQSGPSRPQSGATTTTITNRDGPKSATDSGRRPKTPKSSRKTKSEQSSADQKENRMWIRPRIVQSQPLRTKDPVQLYHFYQKEWERFKQQMPGENDHSELRWQIRHKLMGGGS